MPVRRDIEVGERSCGLEGPRDDAEQHVDAWQQFAAGRQRLLDEFRNELTAIRGDLTKVQEGITDLQGRVTALENRKVLNPIGILKYRMGLAGDRFFGRRPPQYPGGAQPRPGESDLFASEFGTLTAVIGVEGEVEVTISGKSLRLKEGEMVIMPANEPHALRAVNRFKMILIMIRTSK